ncbi:aldose 1-epimerase family protein [Cellulomonas sp. URHB0016]
MNTSSTTTPAQKVLPSGTQHVLARGGHRVVVAAVGASVREYSVDGRDVVLPFDEDRIAPAFSGAVLAPWPNRMRDGEYTFDGVHHEVPVTEHARHTALHGLVAYVAFTEVASRPDLVTLEHVVVPTPGYPWPLRLRVTYSLGDGGLTVHVAATNLGTTAAPYGIGFHPWLSPGDATVDECTLRVDATRRVTVDDRLLPVGDEPAAGQFDLRSPTALQGIVLDDAWLGMLRDEQGLSWIRLTGPDGRTVALWADESLDTWQVCTGDGIPGIERGGVAAEPMTCIADAFRTGDRLVRLEPGDTHEVTWGLTLL